MASRSRGESKLRRIAGFSVLLCIGGCWFACATGSGGPPITVEERTAFDRAAAAERSDPELAKREFESFVDRWPGSSLAAAAGMRLGMLEFDRDQRDQALTWFLYVVREFPRSEYAEEARVRAATLYYAQGDSEAAAALMSRARFSQMTSDQRRAALRVMVSIAKNDVAALRWLSRLRAEEIEEDRVILVDSEIDRTVRRLPSDELVSAADQIGNAVPAARILLVAAERALDQGDLERAEELMDRAARLPLASVYAPRLVGVTERLRLSSAHPGQFDSLPGLDEVPPPDTEGASGTLGVVLPLTGPYASFGQKSLQGVQLAARLFDEVGELGSDERFRIEPQFEGEEDLPSVELGPDGMLERPGKRTEAEPAVREGIRLLIRDSQGRPELAAAAVQELAAHEDVSAIVGPLVRSACEAAAAEAESLGIPLVTLSSREEVASERIQVFRVRTRPSEEVKALVNHAIEDLGAQTFAILYPDDAYGKGLRDLFWEAVEQRGGVIVGSVEYPPDSVDFAGSIRRLVGFELLTPGDREAIDAREEALMAARRLPPEEAVEARAEARAMTGPGEEPLPPIVDFDALFIPESHDKVVLIAPQLAFHEAAGMRLLGPSGWHHPDLLKDGPEYIRGARIAAQFFAASPHGVVEDFSRRYQGTFHEVPDAFAAHAFDATNLVLVQLADGRSSRPDVRGGLLGTALYPGVSGVLSIGSDGNARRRPFLLSVRRKGFIEVD
ncbi:ABC transporter substrate-binding protein [Myxococcota bacterium]|nr:ABC transporter substrate-binding protein [Myxococcota bacterium]